MDEYRSGNQTGTFRWDYDAVGRLVDEVFDSYEDNSLDYTARYAFDLNGNRLTKDLWKTAGTVSGTPDERTSYSYDANDRLLEETLDLLVGSDKRTTYAWGTANGATFQTGKSVTDLAASQRVFRLLRLRKSLRCRRFRLTSWMSMQQDLKRGQASLDPTLVAKAVVFK